MARVKTDDEIIAQGGVWTGPVLELRRRMADYIVDGVRYGTLRAQTKSGSVHDRRLTKTTEEIVTAAFILGRFNYRGVTLVSLDPEGRKLERPDLDARFEDGTEIGIEIAQVGSTTRMKHDAHIAMLEHTIRDLIESDPAFAKAFGPNHLAVSPSSVLGERDVTSKTQGLSLTCEIVDFVRNGEHRNAETSEDSDSGWFGPQYPTLNSRGASYYVSSAYYGPYFGVIDGGTVDRTPELNDVLRVLNKHRDPRPGPYRTKRTWILMYLPDSNELFRNTVSAIEKLSPKIDPFERCCIADACWNLGRIP